MFCYRCICYEFVLLSLDFYHYNALTLLVWRQEGHPPVKIPFQQSPKVLIQSPLGIWLKLEYSLER